MGIANFSFWGGKKSTDPNSVYFDYTILSSNVSLAVTDVVPINLSFATSAPTWWNDVFADGSNIRVFDSAWNELARDVVWIDRQSKKGIININVPISESIDTVIRVAVDKSLVSGYANTDPFGRYNVYGSKYEVVWELQSDPNGASYIAPQDRTSNGRNVYDKGGLVAANVLTTSDGFRRTNFANNANNIMRVATFNINSSHTISFVTNIYSHSTIARDVVVSKGRPFFGDYSGEVFMGRNKTGYFHHKIASTNTIRSDCKYLTFDANHPANTEFHAAGSWDGTNSTDAQKVIIDAVVKTVKTTGFTTLWGSTFEWNIGGGTTGTYTYPLDGEVGYIRISNGVRPLTELEVERDMYLKHSTICTYSAESTKILP